MTPPSDWPQHEDSNAATSLPVDTPDLFGGVLFGDELIDMYNSEAVVGEHSHEIPTLLHGPDSDEAMDDGFGAFRPSTSFNDLTTLLDSADPAAVSSIPIDQEAVATAAAAASASAPKSSGSGGKKRAATSEATGKAAVGEGPAAKKRATVRGAKVAVTAQGGRRGGAKSKAATTTTKAPPHQSAGNAALKLRHEHQAMLLARNNKAGSDTPNPLMATVGKTPEPTATAGASAKARAHAAALKGSGGKGDSITSEAAAAKAVAAAASVSLPAAASNLAGKRTESDFKSVAQAAVTNLILNAGTKKNGASAAAKSSADADGFNIKVDTSTAHIKALTSSNWVNACSGVEGTTCPSVIDNKANNNRARRQNLTPDERARQNRDRNREHARNTRLRKKAYVEELKRTLTELVAQRDSADLEKRHVAQRELEQREVRFRVMEEFLKLRGRNESNSARWVAILEDSFELTLPVTSFRETVHEKDDDSTELEQELYGAEEVMADSSHLSAFLQSLGSTESSGTPVTLQYDCERKNFFMDGATAVLQWRATSDGAVSKGAVRELSTKGTMQAKFSPASNKLISAEITFDTGSVSSQLGCLVRNDSAGSGQVDDAAQAAHRADALLDSLQMPHLTAKVPSAISVETHNVTSADESAADSVASSEKGDLSSDESTEGAATKGTMNATKVVSPRRSARVHG